ncbi:MAG: NADPH:quinone reductase [Alphaproteobacteria bacterium]|nr:NADPH:quinone reductase [Alphaproteobacteria bacterium]
MQSIQIDEYGGPEVLVRRDVPMPHAGDNEVLIQIAYSGVNFMDVHTREGKYAASRTYPVRLPTTLGMEGAGTVVEVGAGVDGLERGDPVAYCLHWSSYAEYAVVPAWRVVKVPAALPLQIAAASLFHGYTAHYLAHDVGRLGPGTTCLVHGASGGIGQILVQLAKRAGARVFATTSTEEKAEVARSRGADVALLYEDGRFADAIVEATDGKGVDVVFDAIGQTTLRDSFRATRKRGLVVNYGSVSGSVRDLDPIELGEAGSLFLTRPRLADHLPDAETVRRRADDIFSALIDGTLTVTIGGAYTFDNVEDAHAALEHRTMIGKPLLKIG